MTVIRNHAIREIIMPESKVVIIVAVVGIAARQLKSAVTELKTVVNSVMMAILFPMTAAAPYVKKNCCRVRLPVLFTMMRIKTMSGTAGVKVKLE